MLNNTLKYTAIMLGILGMVACGKSADKAGGEKAAGASTGKTLV